MKGFGDNFIPTDSHFTLFTTLQGEWTLQNDNSGGDAHAYEFCEALYDASAKCHQYLSSSSSVYEVCQHKWRLTVPLAQEDSPSSHFPCCVLNSPRIRRRQTAAYATLSRAWKRIIMMKMAKSTCPICTLMCRSGQIIINTQRLCPQRKSLDWLHPSVCF